MGTWEYSQYLVGFEWKLFHEKCSFRALWRFHHGNMWPRWTSRTWDKEATPWMSLILLKSSLVAPPLVTTTSTFWLLRSFCYFLLILGGSTRASWVMLSCKELNFRNSFGPMCRRFLLCLNCWTQFWGTDSIGWSKANAWDRAKDSPGKKQHCSHWNHGLRQWKAKDSPKKNNKDPKTYAKPCI